MPQHETEVTESLGEVLYTACAIDDAVDESLLDLSPFEISGLEL